MFFVYCIIEIGRSITIGKSTQPIAISIRIQRINQIAIFILTGTSINIFALYPILHTLNMVWCKKLTTTNVRIRIILHTSKIDRIHTMLHTNWGTEAEIIVVVYTYLVTLATRLCSNQYDTERCTGSINR